jgi:hypothetical protein
MPLFAKTQEEAENIAPYNGQLWEYKTLNLNFKASVAFEGEFNKLGSQGWEFVAMASRDKVHRAIFKRPANP